MLEGVIANSFAKTRRRNLSDALRLIVAAFGSEESADRGWENGLERELEVLSRSTEVGGSLWRWQRSGEIHRESRL
jgi:hypothetical protein